MPDPFAGKTAWHPLAGSSSLITAACQYPGSSMLLTSYFAKSAKHPGAVSIARFPPKWYTGRCYYPLAPEPEMLQIGDWDEYRRRYRDEILAVLNPDQVLRDLGAEGKNCDIVLLCFEKDRSHCHRGLVAEWFLEMKGIEVPERGDVRGQKTLF